MHITFSKYHGAGNDFIFIDDRSKKFISSGDHKHDVIAFLCHRRYGVGADGLILISGDPSADFHMYYYNSDGQEGSLCGNGSRCAAAFAFHSLFPGKEHFRFMGADGLHQAVINDPHPHAPVISVSLNPAAPPKNISPDNYTVNTGSPHLVRFVKGLSSMEVTGPGREIRHSDQWGPAGINVNFVEETGKNTLSVRTYERGVENETLSCGTGVTAAAIAAWTHNRNDAPPNNFIINTRGGILNVSFRPPEKENDPFREVILTGPAQFVFRGEMDLDSLKLLHK